MITKAIRFIRKFFWLLPGLLLWAAFPPMGERMDVLFALAPLMWLSRRATVRKNVKSWFVAGSFFWVATLSWMPAIVKNGGPWPLVLLGWGGLAAYCAAYFAAYGWASATYWEFVRRKGRYGLRILGVLVVEPILWCGFELVRSRFLGGFAWNQLGVVVVNAGFGSPVSLGGVYLCSAIAILINGTIAGIGERMWRPELSGFPTLRKFGGLETLLAFALVFAICELPAGFRPTRSALGSVTVALVQRDFPCAFSTVQEDPCAAYSNLLSNVSHLEPELVVLPESAMCEFGPLDHQCAMGFANWAQRLTKGCVLAGGTRYGDGTTYNSAALYGSGTDIQVYDKVHLVPFGEFIPGDKLFPALQKLAPVGSCTPGELSLLNHRGIPIGVAICFEDTDSALIREMAARGAKLLVFITNDSWFSRSNEAEQHAWQAVARAIETGLPVVRVGNSGVTGTILPDGKISWLIGPNGRPLVDRRGTMFDRVPVDGCPQLLTPYVFLGDIPLTVAFVLLIVALILIKYREHHEKRRYLSM